MTTRIGILGTGHLAEFVIRGAAGKGFAFTVSPRSADRAAGLAQSHGVQIARDNQALVDGVALVLVALPAAEGLSILQGLRFRPDHSLLSAMAGVGAEALAAAVAPARVAISMMPGLANAHGLGPCLLYPDRAEWRPFLSALGPVHALPDEAHFATAASFGALSGASFFWMEALIDWFCARGLSPALARQLVAETLRGNAEVLLREAMPLDEIRRGIATPGGITELLVADLRQGAALDRWGQAMDLVLRRMTRPPATEVN